MEVFRMHAISCEAFDTTGAWMQPGRWHSKGTRVIYAAEHTSLAVLETLIHSGGRKLPPRAITRIQLPDNLRIESTAWLEIPDSQSFGDAWVQEGRSAVLRVPSIAVNRMESNFLLNPQHPDFLHIDADPALEFLFSACYFSAG